MSEQQKRTIKENKFALTPQERTALIEAKIERANAHLATIMVQLEAIRKTQPNFK